MQDTLPFPFNTPPAVSFALLAGWLFFFVTGKLQLRKVRILVEKSILDRASALGTKPRMTLREYYDMVLPELIEKVRGAVWYVPHRTELFPVPAKADYVIERLGVGPEFVGRVLVEGGIELKGGDFHKVKRAIELETSRK